MDMGRGEERVMCGKSNMETYITICKTDSQRAFAVWLRNRGSVLTTLGGGMGREMGGRFKRVEIYVYLWLIHADISEKTTKFYKAIVRQLKNIYIYKKTWFALE